MLTRRSLLAIFAFGAAQTALLPLARAEHPSVGYMKQVAKDLLVAHRQGTVLGLTFGKNTFVFPTPDFLRICMVPMRIDLVLVFVACR